MMDHRHIYSGCLDKPRITPSVKRRMADMVITCLIRGEALRADKHARGNYESDVVHCFTLAK